MHYGFVYSRSPSIVISPFSEWKVDWLWKMLVVDWMKSGSIVCMREPCRCGSLFIFFFVLFVLLHSNPFPPLDFERVVIGHTDELFFHSSQCFFSLFSSKLIRKLPYKWKEMKSIRRWQAMEWKLLKWGLWWWFRWNFFAEKFLFFWGIELFSEITIFLLEDS